MASAVRTCPTTNTIVPLKSKILVTKGALGTEHPYGDALDVAKTFLESGGEQVQMYNSNYYGVFGVTATIEQYCDDLKNYICPAVVAWKEAWKEEHGTPEAPKDNIGARIDIDEAIVYVPINEGTPNGGNFQNAWKSFYDAIKSVDKNASLAGPNSAGYGTQFTSGQSNKSFVQFCADNNCMPDVITWHELQTNCLNDMSGISITSEISGRVPIGASIMKPTAPRAFRKFLRSALMSMPKWTTAAYPAVW